MSQGPDIDDGISVEGDGVTVEKRFTADEFPVPAIEFTLRSDRAETTEFSLVDSIPEEFPMDRIGFHPEYESEHWTAYQDHRVEYRRRLDPGEEVVTVYGIRVDEPDEEDGSRFLVEPTISEVAEDEDPVGDVADVLGDDSSQAVRDVLAGDEDAADEGVDGLDLAGAESDLDAGAADPLGDDDDPLGADADSVAEADDEDDEPEDVLDLDGDDEPVDSGAPSDDEDAADHEADDDDETEETLDLGMDAVEADAADDDSVDEYDPEDDTDHEEEIDLGDDLDEDVAEDDPLATGGEDVEAADEPADGDSAVAGGVGAGGVAAALAEELRAGTVSEEDRAVLKEELELDYSTSVDARIARLQSKVEDTAAYSDAMEEFIDENGLATEWMDGLQADLDSLDESLEETWSELDAAADDREALREELDAVRSEAEAANEEVDAVWDEVDSWGDDLAETSEDLESSLAEVRTELDDLAEEVADEDEALAEVHDRLDTVADDVESVSAMVDDELSEVRAEMTAVHDELAEFEQFRERLTSVFGPGGTGADTDVDAADDEHDEE